MYQTKDNFKGFPMAIMLAQSYSHSCLSRTQEGWLPHMDFSNPPLPNTLEASCSPPRAHRTTPSHPRLNLFSNALLFGYARA